MSIPQGIPVQVPRIMIALISTIDKWQAINNIAVDDRHHTLAMESIQHETAAERSSWSLIH